MKAIFVNLLLLVTLQSVYSQLPTALFNVGSNIFCPGLCTNFINQSTNSTSYQWIFQGGAPATSTDTNPSIVCYQPGDFDVTLIAYNSNGSDTLLIPNCIHIYPYPPQIGIYQSGDTLRTNPGLVSYQWYLNIIPIPGATNYIYIANVAGDYAVLAIDTNGCETEANLFDIYAKIDETICDLIISPNPAAEYLDINRCQFSGEIEIKILNIFGSVVKSESRNSQSEININLKELLPGIYFVNIKNGKDSWTKRIIKE